MNLKDFVLKYICRFDITQPEIGMKLRGKIPELKRVTIEVVEVSENKKHIYYKFLTLSDGIEPHRRFQAGRYYASWFWLIQDSYRLC